MTGLPPRTLDVKDLERARVPKGFWGVRRSALPKEHGPYMDRFVANFEEWLKDGRSYLLHGEAGIGKTSFSVLLLKLAMTRYKTACFVNAADYREATRSWDPEMFSDSETLPHRCQSVDVLVIDELTEPDPLMRHNWRTLDELVTKRIQDVKMTVITTTLPKSLYAKVKDLGVTLEKHFVALEMKGTDLRETRRAKNKSELLGSQKP